MQQAYAQANEIINAVQIAGSGRFLTLQHRMPIDLRFSAISYTDEMMANLAPF